MKDRHLMSAEIMAVGTEILLGSLLDTNTAWLSRRLAALGVAVDRHTTLGDDKRGPSLPLSRPQSRRASCSPPAGWGPPPPARPTHTLGAYGGRWGGGKRGHPGAVRTLKK